MLPRSESIVARDEGENSVLGLRALVTGASGFIGVHLCDRLLSGGMEVHRVSRHRRKGSHGQNWLQCDLTDMVSVQNVIDAVDPDLVFHLSGLVNGARGIEMVVPTFDANLRSTVNLLTACARAGCGRVVIVGSQEEPDDGDSSAPCSPYAAAKWAARGYCRMFFELYSLPVVLARVFMVYGPGQRDEAKLVPYTIGSLLTGEPPKCTSGIREVDWIYVDDVVDALIAAARAPGVEGRSFDIGTGVLTSIRRVVESLVRIAGSSLRPLFGVIPDRPSEVVRRADLRDARRKLNWSPTVLLEDGLRRTFEFYRRQFESEHSRSERSIGSTRAHDPGKNEHGDY